MKDTHHRDRHLPDAAGNGDWQAEVDRPGQGPGEKAKRIGFLSGLAFQNGRGGITPANASLRRQ